MGFAGEITTIGLPDVFRNLAFNRMTGLLVVGQAAVFFEEGNIRAFRGTTLDYESIAERVGAAPQEAIEQARSRRRRHTLREALEESLLFDGERFDAGVRAAVEEELLRLLGRRDASFLFDENPPAPGDFDDEQLACGMRIDPEALADEAARREDEWHAISERIGSENDIFLAKPVDGEVPPEAAALLPLLDGTRDLRASLEDLPFPRFRLLRTVSELLESGDVVRATPEHLRDFARHAEECGEINRAARLLGTAIDIAPENVELRRDLIALFENAGRKNEAALACKRLAAVQEERGDIRRALESYGQAADLAPHDADTLERIASIHDARGDARAHRKAARRLAAAHSAHGRYTEALAVLQDLLKRDPQSLRVREAIAATYIKMHEPQNAAQELLSLAESASAVNGYHRALHYYRSVLAVDRNCSVAARRIEEIEAGRMRVRLRERRRRLAAAVLAAVIGLLSWQVAREVLAQEALNRAADASAGAAPGRAISHYATICNDFSWTRGAARAEELVRHRLLAELHTVRQRMQRDPESAEQKLRQLGRVHFPDGVRDLWRGARDNLLRNIARIKATDWAGR